MIDEKDVSVLVGLFREKDIDNISDALLYRVPQDVKKQKARFWGVKSREYVCPKCESYLDSNIEFIPLDDKNPKRKITFCPSCGQALDWGKYK